MTGGELSALYEIHTDRRDHDYLLAARLALFCRTTIGTLWTGNTPNEFQLLGWDEPESAEAEVEAREDAAFDAIWSLAVQQQGAEVGH